MKQLSIPIEAQNIIERLEKHGFEAYVVGGCVRDLLLGIEPKDWDIATSAKPEEIQKIFPKNFYENRFFTVTILTESENPQLSQIEATTYRTDEKYENARHPEEVSFAKTIEEDLARRDFTVNAMALRLKTQIKNKNDNQGIELIDPFGGEEDLKKRVLRAVGNPKTRFQEDALRMMRAVRLASQLGFSIEKGTKEAVQQLTQLTKEISQERIRDEFSKIILSPGATEGVELLQDLGLLQYIIPELQEGLGVAQNKHHKYTVWEHNLKSLEYAAKKGWSLEVRISALLHDIGKPRAKRGEGENCTFYGHQVVGAKMARKLLERMRFPQEVVKKVVLLVREHMFVYDPEAVTLKGVRRLLARVGVEHIDDLFLVREADRIGSGVPKAQPYRLRHLKAMVEKVKQDPISPKMISLNGTEVMEILAIDPGPRVGAVLAILLEEVIEDPSQNTRDWLEKRAQELGKLTEKDLLKIAGEAKRAAQEAQDRIDQEIKSKYFVK
ncbi:MAG: CCA tRNA nucleotidyltransferase [bacterium]|nr:CCA tRNA nucleotidyltransferase [bacterium]